MIFGRENKCCFVTFWDIVKSPFVWGLALGLFLAGLSVWSHFKTSRELRRLKRHLSDKLEIEADQHAQLKKEKEKLKNENENLRIKIGSGKDASARDLQRELEIFARAERSMTLNAPGFAPAWEMAKSAAAEEVSQEDQGKSLPKKLFRKFFGSGGEEKPKALETSEDSEEAADEAEGGREENSSASRV